MPQPNASEVQAKLRARYGSKAGSTRTGGGKNAMRRKKFRQKKSTNEFEKRLQANLKKLSCNTIPGIEEVNLFKSDGTVIHFISPKVDAEVSSNTFIVSGNYTHNKIEELLPDILPQIGSDHLTQLKDYAEKFEALKPNNDDDQDANVGLPGVVGADDGDVPMLIDEGLNFEQVAQSDEKKQEQSEDTQQTEQEQEQDQDQEQEQQQPQTEQNEDVTTEETTEVKNDGDDNDNDDNDNDNKEEVAGTDDAANDDVPKKEEPKKEEPKKDEPKQEEEEAPKQEEQDNAADDTTEENKSKPTEETTEETADTTTTEPSTETTS